MAQAGDQKLGAEAGGTSGRDISIGLSAGLGQEPGCITSSPPRPLRSSVSLKYSYDKAKPPRNLHVVAVSMCWEICDGHCKAPEALVPLQSPSGSRDLLQGPSGIRVAAKPQ